MPHAAAVQRRRPCGLAAELTRVRAGFSACPPNPGRWQSREPIFSGPLSFPLCSFLARRNRTTARSGPVFPFPSLHGSGHATKLARTHRQTDHRNQENRNEKNEGGGPFARRVITQRPSRKLRVGQCHALKPFGGFPQLVVRWPPSPPLLPARYRTDLVLGRGPAFVLDPGPEADWWELRQWRGGGGRGGGTGEVLVGGKGENGRACPVYRVPVNVPDGGIVPSIRSPTSRRASPFPRLSRCLPCRRDGYQCVACCWGRRGVFVLSSLYQDRSHLFLGDGPDLADSRVNITVVELPLEAGFPFTKQIALAPPPRRGRSVSITESLPPLSMVRLGRRLFRLLLPQGLVCLEAQSCARRSRKTVLACRREQWGSKR